MSSPPRNKRPSKQKFLPLRELTLNSRPLAKRAIQFSSDGDLAVSADDSVHVFVPEFPDFSKQRDKLRQSDTALGTADDDGESSEEEGGEGGGGGGGQRNYNHQILRAQYSEGSKHMPVSFPPLDPRVNRELFEAVGLAFPYDGITVVEEDEPEENKDENREDVEGGGEGDEEEEGEEDDDEDDDSGSDDSEGSYDSDEDEDEDSDDDSSNDNSSQEGGQPNTHNSNSNRPYGAGYGPITGAGSSMNQVISLRWSPSGLGVHRRPILAVLTGAGTLTVFGDGGESANILSRANEGMLQRQELNSWMVLWGVGERLVLPGQQVEVSEYLRGFAWAKGLPQITGQALLATVNDVGEVAVIGVQCVLVHQEDEEGGEGEEDLGFRTQQPGERAVWLVREVARFKGQGPHTPVDKLDPDFVPFGTSYGISWSPWLEEGDSRSSLISFVDRGYVGFRKITIKGPWTRGEVPEIEVGKEDHYGMCVPLATDAFVEFEDAVWTHGLVTSCRGLLSTGFELKPFDVAMAGGPVYKVQQHNAWDCQTVYRPSEAASQNPIVDLVVHPPNLANPTPTPLYTLIRMSATATNHDWYQTNVPQSNTEDPRPQWVRTIAQKLDVQVPVDMHLTRNYDDSGSEGSGSEPDDVDDDDDGDDDDMMGLDGDLDSLADIDDDDEDRLDGFAEPTVLDVPEIHPHRYRLHGLTLSPGGGVAAALVSNHSTQRPERGGWHTVRSNVLFGHKPRRPQQPVQTHEEEPDDSNIPIDPQFMAMSDTQETSPPSYYNNLTTEAKLFESLYGGGPEVPGIHYLAGTTTTNGSVNSLFAPALLTQHCDLCHAPMDQRRQGGSLSGCRNGHFFGTCATSGLAVQTPGATRSCGACGLRTMRAEVLVGRVLAAQGEDREGEGEEGRREEVRRLIGEGVCGACGGKFLS